MSDPAPPKCGKCGVVGVKLWRSYGMFLRDEDVQCATCCGITAADLAKDPHGKGWRVACIHAPDGSVWGYTSAPTVDIERWTALPLAAPSTGRTP